MTAIRITSEKQLAEAIDQIGTTQDLFFLHQRDLRDAIKHFMEERGLTAKTGATHSASIAESAASEISVRKFYNRFTSAEIDEKQFLSCLSVLRTPALRVIDAKTLEKMTRRTKGEPKLSIRNIKHVNCDLATRLRAIADFCKENGIGRAER